MFLKALVLTSKEKELELFESLIPSHWTLVRSEQAVNVAFVELESLSSLERVSAQVKRLFKKNSQLEVCIFSHLISPEVIQHFLSLGVQHYMEFPFCKEELRDLINKISKWKEYLKLQKEEKMPYVGGSEKTTEVLKKVAFSFQEKGPFLIEGESGTGKEVISQLFHEKETPFVAVNISAVPENIFESELFGYMKGAFTGAQYDKKGLIESAAGGTLFIDEIEALPFHLQSKLLRFLETGEIQRLGSAKNIHVKTKVVVATNEKLECLVKEERFRKDLFWRLSGCKISLPPLRERKEDIKMLCKIFLKTKTKKKALSQEALEVFLSHSWPGNVRELKKICEGLLLSVNTPMISQQAAEQAIKERQMGEAMALSEHLSCKRTWEQMIIEYEKEILSHYLNQYKEPEKVAKVLELSRSTVYKKIKDYAIHWK